eukprot:g6141.t1
MAIADKVEAKNLRWKAHDAAQLVTAMQVRKDLLDLHAGEKMTQEERVKLTALRVGLNTPELYESAGWHSIVYCLGSMFRREQRQASIDASEDSDEGYYESDDDLEDPASQRDMADPSATVVDPYYSRGTLDELGVNWWRLRRVDLRWLEKVLAVVDTLQIYALMWSLSQPWPWPRPWLSATRWTVAANLDFLSSYDAAMTVTGPGTSTSPWGERQGYVGYAFMYTLVPVGIHTLWYFRRGLTLVWLDRGVLFHRIVLGENKPPPPSAKVVTTLIAFERALLLAAHLLYLPVVLAVIRLLLCDGDGTLSADPTTSCRSATLVLPAMLGITVVVLYTLDLKRHTTNAAHAVTTYGGKSDHERFLQRVEIEYILNLCTGWEADHLWMVSSFRRHAVRLHLVLHATLFLDSLLGMMTGYGVRAPFVVHSHQFTILATTNFVAAVLGGGFVISTPIENALARRRHRKRMLRSTSRPGGSAGSDDEALVATSGGEHGNGSTFPAASNRRGSHTTPATTTDAAAKELVYPDRWPTRSTLIALAKTPQRREWVDAIRRAKEFRFRCEMCPKGLEPISALEAFMRHMRAIWAEAKAEDSALEPALSAALERLALVHARMAYRVKKDGGGLTAALEEALLDPSVVAGMQRRYRAQALMTDRQKRVMLKLFAVSAFLNHRDFRDSSAASVLRLRDETDRIFSQPLTADSRASLKTVCVQWKRLIQKSEREFEEAHGHAPLVEDKEANSEWYGFYKKLRAALASLPAAGPGDAGNVVTARREGTFSIRRDYDPSLALTPAASESLVTLIRATEQLLAAKESAAGVGVGTGGFDVTAAEACRKQWKRVIRVWEADFERQTGSPPGVSDKQLVRSYYESYRRLKDSLATGG